MAQITTGIRSLLSLPAAYNFLQYLAGSKKALPKYVTEYILPKANDKILDIGCGTANILNYFPSSIHYYGFDLDKSYINYAKRKFGSRGTFICNDVNNNLIKTLPKFDIILATGLLHHLNDPEALKLFSMAAEGLKDTGRMITLDCCYVSNQSKLAAFIIKNDRGRNIRSPEAYQALALKHFSQVKVNIRHDMLNIPYTHTVMKCSK